MHARNRFGARQPLALLVAVLFVVSLWVGAAPPAQAVPANTMTLAELQILLDVSGGSASGYFKTVLGGDTIVDVPATISAIVPRMTQDGALILLSVEDARVLALGGIASGMSGSPLYVKVGGQPDQLVGAVSYGDIFTLDGLGLATPIEYMTAIQESYLGGAEAPAPLRSAALPVAVTVAGRSVNRVVVASSVARARTVRGGASTAVFAPLAAVQIGGLNPRTQAYKVLKGRLEARGFSVLPAVDVAASGDPQRMSPLAGGAALAALYARGDLWAGAAGTVTYVDGDALLGFGHPLEWLGPTQAYLTNAWVAGIWGSSLSPYKLIVPTALRGTITEDRGSGVAGTVGALPPETTVTSSATFGGRTLTGSSAVPQALASGTLYSWLPAEAAAVPVYKVLDQWSFPGSARTVSTVVVSDGVQDYTVARTNVWDDAWDVSFASTFDLWTVLTTLTANPDGIAPATIKSVTFQGTYDADRDAARIVSARVPGGLRTGANDVQVSLAVHGVPALQTAHVPLTIPAGTPLRGTIEVYGVGGGGPSTGDSTEGRSSGAGDDRQSVAELVAELNDLPLNSDIVVTFRPEAAEGTPPAPIEAVGGTEWFVTGSLQLPTSSLRLSASPKTVTYGHGTTLFGTIELVAGDTVVDIYATPKGATTRKLVATVPAEAFGQTASFEYRVPKMKATTRFTAVWGGDAANLGSSGSVVVTVRPRAAVSAGKSAK
jgi:hypothetical protein